MSDMGDNGRDYGNGERISVPRFRPDQGFSTSEKLSEVMKAIRSTGTKPEVAFQKAIWRSGFRYRKHYSMLAGKPDLVFVSRKIVVFIDGDFWHGYNWEARKAKMKSNRDYWIPKIERNIQRDDEVNLILKKGGWIVIRFWEHQIKSHLDKCVSETIKLLLEHTRK